MDEQDDPAMSPDKPKGESLPVVRRCQVCGEPLSVGVIVECNTCSTPHHRDCWRYNRGCSTFGCTCRTFKAGSSALSSLEEPFSYKQPHGWKTILAFIVGVTALSCAPVPFITMGPVMGVLCTLVSIFLTVAPFLFQFELTFLPDTGRVERQLLFAGRPFGEPEQDFLSADSIAEVHLQRFGGPQGAALAALYLALTDGSRIRLRQVAAVEADNIEVEAERLARFADTTVRLVLGKRAPSATEIRQAAIEKGATGALPTHALPPANDGAPRGEE